MAMAASPPVEATLTAISAAVLRQTGHMGLPSLLMAVLSLDAASACLRTRSCIDVQPLFMPALCSSGTKPSAVWRNLIRVPPSTSLSRYCTLETKGNEANSGPTNSSSVGRMMAFTLAQKCPLPSPMSRYQRPPGHASIFMLRDLPSGVSLPGPSCSSSAAKVMSRGAWTWISWLMVRVRSSRVWVRWRSSFSLGLGLRIRICEVWRTRRFGEFLHSMQLVLPVALEGPGPLVERAYRFGVGAVELLAALAAHPDQAHIAQHAQVLGDGGLLQAEGRDDLADRPLGMRRDRSKSPAGAARLLR